MHTAHRLRVKAATAFYCRDRPRTRENALAVLPPLCQVNMDVVSCRALCRGCNDLHTLSHHPLVRHNFLVQVRVDRLQSLQLFIDLFLLVESFHPESSHGGHKGGQAQ